MISWPPGSIFSAVPTKYMYLGAPTWLLRSPRERIPIKRPPRCGEFLTHGQNWNYYKRYIIVVKKGEVKKRKKEVLEGAIVFTLLGGS